MTDDQRKIYTKLNELESRQMVLFNKLHNLQSDIATLLQVMKELLAQPIPHLNEMEKFLMERSKEIRRRSNL